MKILGCIMAKPAKLTIQVNYEADSTRRKKRDAQLEGIYARNNVTVKYVGSVSGDHERFRIEGTGKQITSVEEAIQNVYNVHTVLSDSTPASERTGPITVKVIWDRANGTIPFEKTFGQLTSLAEKHGFTVKTGNIDNFHESYFCEGPDFKEREFKEGVNSIACLRVG